MYTQCPACKTVFRLHPDQLNAAQGQVRCSRCHGIFNAAENLFRPAEPEAPTTVEGETPRQPSLAEGASADTVNGSAEELPKRLLADGETEAPSLPGSLTDTNGEIGATPLPEASPSLPEDAPEQSATQPGTELEQEFPAEAGSTDHTDTIAQAPENASAEEALNLFTEEPAEDNAPLQAEEPVEELSDEERPVSMEEEAPEATPLEQPEDVTEEAMRLFTGEPVEELPHEERPALMEEKAAPEAAPFEQPEDIAEEAMRLFTGESVGEHPAPMEEEAPEAASPEQPENVAETTLLAETAGDDISPRQDEAGEELQASAPNSLSAAHTAADATQEPTEEDEFDEELLSIFDEEPEGKAERETPPAPPVAATTAEELGEAVENHPTGTDDHTGTNPRKVAAAASSWDPFSEENIETLLTDSDDNEPLDDGAVFEEERNRDPLISEDELDLSSWSDPATEMEEDEELLGQRLPEENEVDELELDSIDMSSERQATETPGEASSDPAPAATERPSYSLPLEQEASRGSLAGTLLWGSGILLLLAGLALQYLYYHRMTLAENPGLRPVLAQMCQLTGCQLPPRRDLANIELGKHLVQFHPRYEDSLLITATLVNHADFTQPFPIVEVVMTDLEQRVIARRRFLPDDYLVTELTAQGLPPGTEVPLMLEVVDPGKKAVGFEFNFY